MEHRRIAILGSTGSIGTQTLDVIRRNPDRFEAEVLTAGGNWELLVKQAIEFKPNAVVIADDTKYELVKDALKDYPIKVFAGKDALQQCRIAANYPRHSPRQANRPRQQGDPRCRRKHRYSRGGGASCADFAC